MRFGLSNRCRSRQGEADARPFHACVFDVGDALDDFQVERERLVGRFAGAELPAARERSALNTLEQLLHIEPRDRALAARKAGRAVKCPGQAVDAATGALDRETEIAFTLEPANAEHVTQPLFAIQIGGLHLCPEISAGPR